MYSLEINICVFGPIILCLLGIRALLRQIRGRDHGPSLADSDKGGDYNFVNYYVDTQFFRLPKSYAFTRLILSRRRNRQ
jgi:hypothetical protein